MENRYELEYALIGNLYAWIDGREAHQEERLIDFLETESGLEPGDIIWLHGKLEDDEAITPEISEALSRAADFAEKMAAKSL